MIGTARRLGNPRVVAHSLLAKRGSCCTSSISSGSRCRATQPAALSPNVTCWYGRPRPSWSETARTVRLRATSSATQKVARGTAISSAAASAIARSTSSMSSDDDTMWARRVRLRRRAARTSRAS